MCSILDPCGHADGRETWDRLLECVRVVGDARLCMGQGVTPPDADAQAARAKVETFLGDVEAMLLAVEPDVYED